MLEACPSPVPWRKLPERRLLILVRQGKLSLCQSNMQFLGKRWGELCTKRPEPALTEVPQCRPIEDFFKVLASHFYRKNWLAEASEALLRKESGGASKESLQKLYWRLHKLWGRSFFGRTGWGFSKFTIDCNVFKIVHIREHVCFISNVKIMPIYSDNELSSDFYASPVIGK